MKSITLPWSVCLALVCVLTPPAAAQTPVAPGSTTATIARRADFQMPVDMAALDTYRGGSQLVQNDMTLSGTTAGNTAEQVVTGSNTISSGSFSNMNGLAVSIQNTGANVLIQSAVILHLQMN